MSMQGPPRLPNGLFSPEVVPRVPKHDRKPQDDASYQFGDPGPAIGTLESVTSNFGQIQNGVEECTFVGSEGVARATRAGMQVLRFADSPTLMVRPISVQLSEPEMSPSTWCWLDPQHRPLFEYVDRGLGLHFALHAEAAHAGFWMPRMRAALAQGGVRFWAGSPCYVHLTTDRVEVQQLGRHDVVPARDVSVSMEDNFFELVLRAPHFHEARFLMADVTNRMLLQMCLKSMGAKVGLRPRIMQRSALLSLLIVLSSACSAEPPSPAKPPSAPPAPPPAVTTSTSPVASSAPAAPPAPPRPLTCNDGDPLEVGGRHYCLQRVATTFRESARFCEANGGRLAEIASVTETTELQQALSSPMSFETSAWIGLSQAKSKAPWTWGGGGAATFTAWAPGEPNDSGGVEHCAELHPHSARWNDVPCELPHAFVCERRLTAKAESGAQRCRGAAFRVGAIDYCYHRMRLISWDDAASVCNDQGGRLATFVTRDELDAFRRAIAGRLAEGRLWIGYTDEAREGRWTTVDGKTPTFTRWRPGEPNNSGGAEHCAEWLAIDGGWNDVACDTPHLGLCEPSG
jgi:hypothetical protein